MKYYTISSDKLDDLHFLMMMDAGLDLNYFKRVDNIQEYFKFIKDNSCVVEVESEETADERIHPDRRPSYEIE